MEITLSNGGVAIIDDADYQRPLIHTSRTGETVVVVIAERSWRPTTRQKWSYARTVVYQSSRRFDVCLHRLIAGARPGEIVDHINGVRFDNRRCNLRICSNRQNVRNMNSFRGTSRFKGVYRSGGAWRAQIQAERKIPLGTFASELQAALAYDEAAIKHHGEFARINFPERLRAIA